MSEYLTELHNFSNAYHFSFPFPVFEYFFLSRDPISLLYSPWMFYVLLFDSINNYFDFKLFSSSAKTQFHGSLVSAGVVVFVMPEWFLVKGGIAKLSVCSDMCR